MDNQLIPYNGHQVTPLGNLYVEKVSDTLHRVKRYEINLMGGGKREITYQEYSAISDAITGRNDEIPKFIKFKDGDFIAVNQIVNIKANETIIDTRREDL